jgi:hypothetical protein
MMKIALRTQNMKAARRDSRLDPLGRLILEMVDIMPDVDLVELMRHLGEIVAQLGSVENALEAFERGEVSAEPLQ